MNPWLQVAKYLGLAVLLPAGSMVGYAVGYGLDSALGTHVLKVVFLVLGTIAGFVELIRGLNKG